MKRNFFLISLFVIIFTLSSCQITEDISINSANGGNSASDVNVEDFFITVLEDFSEFSSDNTDESIMDLSVKGFKEQLEKTPTTSNIKVVKNNNNSYNINFDYSNLKTLLSDLGANSNQTVLTSTANSLSFYLDINNYEELTKAIPFLADPNFEPFGPLFNEGLSESDYLEMISFMLGEEGPGAITDSIITINIETPKAIKSYRGGKEIDSTHFQFSFPLIKFLLLAEPLSFDLTW